MLSRAYTNWPKNFEDRYYQNELWEKTDLYTKFLDSVNLYPDQIALADKNTSISYNQLLNLVDHTYRYLATRGYKKGDAVILHFPNSITFYVMLFACFKMGVIPVLALSAHKFFEINYFVQKVKAKGYFTSDIKDLRAFEEFSNKLNKAHPYLQDIESIDYLKLKSSKDKVEKPASHILEPIDGKDVALFQLSGGTTGTPKLIPRTHDDYYCSIRDSNKRCEVSSFTSYLAVLPSGHNFPLSSPGALGIIFSGGKVVIADNAMPLVSFSLIEKHQVTMAALVPSLFRSWMYSSQKDRFDLSSLEVIQVGGQRLLPELAKRTFDVFGCKLQQVFGMAEGLVCYTKLSDDYKKIWYTQGKPMSEYDEILILDDEGKKVSTGTAGHLLVRGPYTIRGYFDAAEHNKKAFTEDGFYKTGDIASIDVDGYLTVRGRFKEQINRAGEKISCDEIENLLLEIDGIKEAALVSFPDEFLGEKSCAFILTNAPESIDSKMIREHFNKRQVAAYKIPDRVEVLDRFPYSAVGKVDKLHLQNYLTGSVK